LLFQPYIMSWYLPLHLQFDLGFTWQLCIGTVVAFLVCVCRPADPQVVGQEVAT